MNYYNINFDTLNCRFRNPAPPPGYVMTEAPSIRLKYPYKNIGGLTCEFFGLIIESGILNALSQPSDIELDDSDKEEPVEVTAKKKITRKDIEPNKVTRKDIEPKKAARKDIEPEKSNTKSDEEEPVEVPIVKTIPRKDIEPDKSNTKSDEEEPVEVPIVKKVTSKEIELDKSEELVEVPISKVASVISVIDLTDDGDSPEREIPVAKVPTKKTTSFKDATAPRQKNHAKSEKVTKTSVNLVYNYSSDSSQNSLHHKRKKERSKSPRSSDDDLICCDVKRVKNDYDYHSVKEELPDQVRGIYYCKICKASMNNEGAYQSHMKGKRHFKALKAHNISKAIEDSIQTQPTLVMMSRYRQPAPNVFRTQTGDIADSQKVIEAEVRSPCPGLEKVIEIQGLHETHYYCGLCDAPCNAGSIIHHLRGYPHQLQCLKYFDPDGYSHVASVDKHIAKDHVTDMLAHIEVQRGCGKLVVERESLTAPSNYMDPLLSMENMPSTSYQAPTAAAFAQSYAKTVVPDSSRPDFYCPVCDSHMNNKIMWESHIRGKRHIKNCKKAPGEAPSKIKAVLVPNARAFLMDDLDQVWKPVVGLDHIRETQKPEVAGAIYNCFLCGACCGAEDDIVDHILTQKHRIKYLEKIAHPDMELLNEMTMSESRMCGIVENICAQVESERGRGYIEVYITKKSVPMW